MAYAFAASKTSRNKCLRTLCIAYTVSTRDCIQHLTFHFREEKFFDSSKSVYAYLVFFRKLKIVVDGKGGEQNRRKKPIITLFGPTFKFLLELCTHFPESFAIFISENAIRSAWTRCETSWKKFSIRKSKWLNACVCVCKPVSTWWSSMQ